MMEDSTMSDPSCDSCWSILPGQQIDDDVGLGVTKFFDQDRAQTPSRPAHVFHFPALVNGDDSAINRQPDSSLFHRLPFEIRMMIYREVLPAERRLWIRPATTHDSSCDFELFPAADAGPIDLEFREEMSQDNWRLTGRSFWKKAALGQAPLHTDSLALMKTCRRAFLELLPELTLSFDQVEHLGSVARCMSWAAQSPIALPIRSIEFISHARRDLYGEPTTSDGGNASGNFLPPIKSSRKEAEQKTWEDRVEALTEICADLPGIRTLKLSVVVAPQSWCSFANQEAVVKSLDKISGVPDIVVELHQKLKRPKRRMTVVLVEGSTSTELTSEG